MNLREGSATTLEQSQLLEDVIKGFDLGFRGAPKTGKNNSQLCIR